MNPNRRIVPAVLVTVALIISSLSVFANHQVVTAAPPAQQTETPTPAPTPLTAENLSSNPGISDNALLMFDGQGVLHLFWTDTSDRATGEYLLHRQRSLQGVWSATENLSLDFEILFGES